jgi:hypothetical protein
MPDLENLHDTVLLINHIRDGQRWFYQDSIAVEFFALENWLGRQNVINAIGRFRDFRPVDCSNLDFCELLFGRWMPRDGEAHLIYPMIRCDPALLS